MRDDDLDRILFAELSIAPSADFVASVMVAVRRENATSDYLSFPWKRALPGIAAAIVSVVLLALEIARSLAALSEPWTADLMFSNCCRGTAWIAVAAVVSVAAVTLGTAVSFYRTSQ